MKRNIVIITIFLLTGCSLIPEFQQPKMDIPAQWRGAELAASLENTAIDTNWWKNFNSAELNRLAQETIANNNDLLASLRRIDQARAAVKIAGSGLYPTVNASGNIGQTWQSGNGRNNSDSSARTGLSTAYEIDLWGRNRAGLESASARAVASQFDYEALYLVVLSEVAQAYFDVLNLRERIEVAQNNLSINKDIANIIDARFTHGSASALELSQQKTTLANTQAALAQLRELHANAENRLAVLLGQPPQNLSISATGLTDLIVPAIPLSQPSSLLQRRPDIKRAESNLIAANADIGIARAAFFPQLNLNADLGIALDPTLKTASIAAGILAPIFQGGALQGRLEQTKARQEELVQSYRQTILVSFQEVEDAVAAVKSANERLAALKTADEEAQNAYQLSRQRFDAGAIDFITFLDTQRAQLQAQDAYSAARLDTLSASIALYKALGGGWNPQ